MDKLESLYETVMKVRRTAGEKPVPFHKFTTLVRSQVKKLRESGYANVTFQVTVKDGQVNLKAPEIEERPSVTTRDARPGTGTRFPGRVTRRVSAVPCYLVGPGDVAGLWTSGAVNDLELDGLAFFERAEPVALDG